MLEGRNLEEDEGFNLAAAGDWTMYIESKGIWANSIYHFVVLFAELALLAPSTTPCDRSLISPFSSTRKRRTRLEN